MSARRCARAAAANSRRTRCTAGCTPAAEPASAAASASSSALQPLGAASLAGAATAAAGASASRSCTTPGGAAPPPPLLELLPLLASLPLLLTAASATARRVAAPKSGSNGGGTSHVSAASPALLLPLEAVLPAAPLPPEIASSARCRCVQRDEQRWGRRQRPSCIGGGRMLPHAAAHLYALQAPCTMHFMHTMLCMQHARHGDHPA